ncbi:MAG: ECF transporter S component [Clostridia bacterium]
MSRKRTSHERILRMTQLAVLSAIIIMMTFVPYIGYISYGPGLSITLIHIPVMIGAIVLGPSAGAILGGVWGISCIIKALTAPPSPLDAAIFWNPLVSLIPRILAGLLAGLAFVGLIRLCRKLSKREKNSKLAQGISAGIAAAVGSVTNTVLVLSMIYLLYGTQFGEQLGINMVSFGGLLDYIMLAFAANASLEVVVCVVVSIPVSYALARLLRSGGARKSS